MASLRDIRKHIAAIKSIKQITYAMKMVAAARIRKAQKAILASRPFAQQMGKMIVDLYGEFAEMDVSDTIINSYTLKRPKGKKCLVLITADKGLCGSFNSNLLKAAVGWIRKNRDSKIDVVVVGKKGKDFLRRIKNVDMEISYELTGIFPKVSYAHAKMLSDHIIKIFSNPETESVTVIYNEFKSMMAQKIVTDRLLPLHEYVFQDENNENGKEVDFIFEPDKFNLLNALFPRHINAQLYRMLLESQAAELAARMTAMEAASKNASELIENLTLRMNKTRQSMITTELNEIVGGSVVLE